MTRFTYLVALAALLVLPAMARAQSTDEVRALAGKNLPAQEAPRPVPAGAVAVSTDDARAFAGRSLPQAWPDAPQAIPFVRSTDEARAVAGGVAVVASAKPETVASCGKSCKCGHHG